MSLPKVQLENCLPTPRPMKIPAVLMNGLYPNRENKNEDVDFSHPRIWKLLLTETSEIEIFGDVSPHRTACLPPLPWGNEQYYENKLAEIDEDQCEIYNAKIQRSYRDKPELILKNEIKSGTVEVSRSGYNVGLKNVVSQAKDLDKESS